MAPSTMNPSKNNIHRAGRLLSTLLIGWLSLAVSFAQHRPAPLLLTLDSLQKQPDIGYRLRRQPIWRFAPGHHAHWANPAFNDRTWVNSRSEFNPPQTPPGWNGAGWFRLHFRIDSSLVGPLLALRVQHRSASEIYLDGQQIGRFGTIGDSPTTHSDYNPHNEPLAFHFTRAGDHVLAVRLATRRPPYMSRHMWNWQGFIMQIGLHKTLTKLVLNLTRIDDLQLALALATGLFALLHLILFVVYPSRLANLYYSGWLMLSTLDFVCAYVDYTHPDPHWQEIVSRWSIPVNFALALTAVAFIYSINYGRQPRRIWAFCALAALLNGYLVVNPTVPPYNLFFGFLLGCMLEVIRVVFLALRQGLPGVWLLGVGIVVAALVLYIGPANQVGLWNIGNVSSLYQQALFTTVGYLVLPLCTSIYLAQDIARTNRNLATQLTQVRDLSAKTLAQEAEKLALVARQNEQLEQTVRQRTGQLQQQTDKLREMDRVKSRFFTNLTHEFRTPLTLMLGPAEQVLAQTQEPATRQQVGLLQRNAQRLLGLINQLLELSKLEAGKAELALVPADWVMVVQGTLHSFESLALKKRITLHFSSNHKQVVMGMDRPKLEAVLYNLLSNALKFTPVDGHVSVELTYGQEGPDAWVELRVVDTGVGIRVDKLPYVFDRFYQVDASDTREQEGTGIGLALTKELVELHGGTIQISSQAGIGTIITVRIPLPLQPVEETRPTLNPSLLALADSGAVASGDRRPDQALAQPTMEPVSRQPLQSGDGVEPAPLVLLIEDNQEVRAFIHASLGNAYSILEAGNGEEGLWLAQETIPDLVITDLMMPRMDGYQVCTSLKQDDRTSHIPIMMLTARADLESKLEGLQTGVDSYLAKPFHQRELLAQLTNLLQVRRKLQEHYRRSTLHQKAIRLSGEASAGSLALPSMEQVFLDRVRTALDTHLDDEAYNVDRLCEEVGLSRTHLHRKLKALINQTPGDWLRILRLQRAHDLLKGNVGTVAEVAYRVGFSNPANFSTSFSRHFGYPPSEVRKKADF